MAASCGGELPPTAAGSGELSTGMELPPTAAAGSGELSTGMELPPTAELRPAALEPSTETDTGMELPPTAAGSGELSTGMELPPTAELRPAALEPSTGMELPPTAELRPAALEPSTGTDTGMELPRIGALGGESAMATVGRGKVVVMVEGKVGEGGWEFAPAAGQGVLVVAGEEFSAMATGRGVLVVVGEGVGSEYARVAVSGGIVGGLVGDGSA